MNSKSARKLRKAIRSEFNMLPERNLHVVKDNSIEYIAGTDMNGKPVVRNHPAPVLAHKDCQRAIYQASKKGRMSWQAHGKQVVNPLLSGVFTG